MKIAQIANVALRVPPKKYGGTERVIFYLTEELVKMGHEVTLFATGDSVTTARLQSVVPKSLVEMGVKDAYGLNIYSMLNVGTAYSMQDQFDIIHDHNPSTGLPAANIARVPVVNTWHGPFGPEITEYFSKLNNTYLVSISKEQARLAPSLNFAGNVYNGLDMKNYPFGAKSKDYLLLVGRIDAEKGVHHAIDTAVALNKKLVIAAKLDDNIASIKEYFTKQIKPRLRKHPDLINWVGEVDEETRNDLMKNALCMLHPVTWPEPFGLVLIEAMACGCPVVAFNKGSIPEVIQDGKTGFVVSSVDEMVAAVKKIKSIDRQYCRDYSINTFSAKRMAEGYAKIYEKVITDFKKKEAKHDRRAEKLPLGLGSEINF